MSAIGGRIARAVLGLGVVGGLGLAGFGLVGRAVSPPDAPLPARTFDVREVSSDGAARQPIVSAASPTSHGQARGAAKSVPVPDPSRLRIPDLGVDAPVSRERVADSGELVIPGDPRAVASWHASTSSGPSASAPASSAPAGAATAGVLVLAGHVDSDGRLGALHPLSQVTSGTQVVTSDDAGRVESWRVDALEVRRKDDLPDFPARGPRRLAIVTCGGPVIEGGGHGHQRSYRDNVVAWASPAP